MNEGLITGGLKLFEECRRDSKQNKLLECFHKEHHTGSHGNIPIQLNDLYDPNNRERPEDLLNFLIKNFICTCS